MSIVLTAIVPSINPHVPKSTNTVQYSRQGIVLLCHSFCCVLMIHNNNNTHHNFYYYYIIIIIIISREEEEGMTKAVQTTTTLALFRETCRSTIIR